MAPPMFHRATITLGIGPRSSSICIVYFNHVSKLINKTTRIYSSEIIQSCVLAQYAKTLDYTETRLEGSAEIMHDNLHTQSRWTCYNALRGQVLCFRQMVHKAPGASRLQIIVLRRAGGDTIALAAARLSYRYSPYDVRSAVDASDTL